MVRKVVRRRRVSRRPLKKRGMKRRGVGRAMVKRQSDYAKVVEIQETPFVATNAPGGESVGAVMNFCLADFQRPQEVAHAYKYYRAAKVEISFIPYFNIAQTGGAGATQLPQLYMTVDRLSNRWIAPTETELLSRGVSPKIFNKKRKLVFKPNLLQGVSLEASQNNTGPALTGITALGYQNAVALFDKWLPTQQTMGYSSVQVPGGGGTMGENTLTPLGVNPYALRYHGAAYVCAIEGLPVGESTTVGDIQLKVTWEFKGPRALKTNTPQPDPNPYAVTSSQGSAYATPNTQPTTYP